VPPPKKKTNSRTAKPAVRKSKSPAKASSPKELKGSAKAGKSTSKSPTSKAITKTKAKTQAGNRPPVAKGLTAKGLTKKTPATAPSPKTAKPTKVKSPPKPASSKAPSSKTPSAVNTKPLPKGAKAPKAKPVVAKITPPPKSSKKASATPAAPITSARPPAKPAVKPPIAHPIAARKSSPPPPPPPKKSNTSPDIVAKIRSAQAEKELRKDLAQTPPKKTLTPITTVPPLVQGQDRIVLMVRDPYWLHAHWDITRQTVDRAKAALAEHWHSVRPILRLLKLDDSGTTESAENVYRDLEIHGGVRNWYIDVDSPPSRFQIVMGYMTSSGRFYELVRSNTVTTPVPGGKEASDDHWADVAKDAERIYAMSGGYGDETQRGELAEVFEERLKRTMDLDVLSQFGSGAEGGLKRARQFHFTVDAELIVFGSTHPDAHVTIGTEPVKVRSDGTFSIRLPFPDRRQVLPATARSRDGVDEQTVVIAVERNTKVMEPLSMEGDEP